MTDTSESGSCCGIALGKKLNDKFPFQQQEGAMYALRLLSAINLLNFADRYVPAAVKSEIQDDLNLNDFQTALPNTGMIIVFMISAVIFGQMADKNVADRRIVLAGGVIFWSITTALAGLSQNLIQLIIFRSLVGVGEAAYGSIAPPMLFDFFPSHDRNVTYGVYYLAIPVGAALGFGFGSVLASIFGWRWAFVACGIPGIIVAMLIIKLNNPVDGINDISPRDDETGVGINDTESLLSPSNKKDDDIGPSFTNKDGREKEHKSATFRETISEIYEIVSNPVFFLCVLGLAANNFALGGIADWITVFMERYQNASLEEAGLVVGAATVCGGIIGTYLGSVATNYYDTRIKNAYFLIPALFTLPSALCLFVAVNVDSKYIAYLCLMIGDVFIWTNVAPICSLSIDVIPVHLRARASGLAIFCQHILGDIISPPLIGFISDQTGSLRIAMQLPWIAILLSGLCWYSGYAFIPKLPVMKHHKELEEIEQEQEQQQVHEQKPEGEEKLLGTERSDYDKPALLKPPITYGSALCPWYYDGDPCCGNNDLSDSYYVIDTSDDVHVDQGNVPHSTAPIPMDRERGRQSSSDVDIYKPPHGTVLSSSVCST